MTYFNSRYTFLMYIACLSSPKPPGIALKLLRNDFLLRSPEDNLLQYQLVSPT